MLVVSGILVVPRTGAATFSVVLITGQLIGALIMDHFGWLGLSERPISLSRIAGIIFLLLGIWLVQRR
jgi:transporter family-2 protein